MRSTSSLPLFIFLLTFYLSPVHAWASSTSTPSNATVVVDLQSLDAVACLGEARAPHLGAAKGSRRNPWPSERRVLLRYAIVMGARGAPYSSSASAFS